MVRSFANSVLSLVALATFLWGGCVSCEQFFMFPGKRQPCCNKSGQCERPGRNSPTPEKQDCNRLPLERGQSAHVLPPPAVTTTIAAQLAMPLSEPFRYPGPAFLVDPSPPDRQALNATFLI